MIELFFYSFFLMSDAKDAFTVVLPRDMSQVT